MNHHLSIKWQNNVLPRPTSTEIPNKDKSAAAAAQSCFSSTSTWKQHFLLEGLGLCLYSRRRVISHIKPLITAGCRSCTVLQSMQPFWNTTTHLDTQQNNRLNWIVLFLWSWEAKNRNRHWNLIDYSALSGTTRGGRVPEGETLLFSAPLERSTTGNRIVLLCSSNHVISATFIPNSYVKNKRLETISWFFFLVTIQEEQTAQRVAGKPSDFIGQLCFCCDNLADSITSHDIGTFVQFVSTKYQINAFTSLQLADIHHTIILPPVTTPARSAVATLGTTIYQKL